MKPRYNVNIRFSEGKYIAEVPSLANCFGTGDSYQSALADAERAISAWISEAINAGHPVPPALPKNTAKHIRPVAIPTVVGEQNADNCKTVADLMLKTSVFRKKRCRSQSGFWLRFGVTQSTGSRYERVVDGQVRQLPMPLAILVALHEIGKLRDSDLVSAHALLKPYYPEFPPLNLTPAPAASAGQTLNKLRKIS